MDIDIPEKKMRMGRTTHQQYEIYLNEIEKNPNLRENKYTGDQPDILKKSWESLVSKLNASGGPIKDIPGWKKTFADWKCLIRKRARVLKNVHLETGNRGGPEKPLTEIESKLLFLTGEIVVDGLPNIKEIGLKNNENENIKDKKEKMKCNTRTVLLTKKNQSAPKTSISSKLDTFSKFKSDENTELKKINENLETIIKQNDTKIWLMQKKIELKYNVQFEDIKINPDKKTEECETDDTD